MNKMIARTALVATLAVSAMSLSACGTNNTDCSHAAGANTTITANTAMFPSRAGGGHGSSGHGGEGGHGESAHSETSTGSHESTSTESNGGGFVWPHWFGGSHSDQCPKSETASN